jgi:hypothetical protein
LSLYLPFDSFIVLYQYELLLSSSLISTPNLKTSIAPSSKAKMTAKEKKGAPSQDEALRRRSIEYARKDVIKKFTNSTIEDNSGSYPTFDLSELKLGKVLGKGGFGTVSEVKHFKTDANAAKVATDTADGDDEKESRNFIAQQ